MRSKLLPAMMAGLMAVAAPALAAPSSTASAPPVDGTPKGDGVRMVADAAPTTSQSTIAAPAGTGGLARIVPLPQVLSAHDVDAYRRVFQLEDAGQWAAADKAMGAVADPLLKGHVLARRYLASGTRPGYQELWTWMNDYADHPEAEAIYHLAMSKGLGGFAALKQPVRGYLKGNSAETADDGVDWEGAAFDGSVGTARGRAEVKRVRNAVRNDDGDKATTMIAEAVAQGLAAVDIDQMKLAVALDAFHSGRVAEAARLASEAADRSGNDLPAAAWVAGLSEWQQGRPERARRYFEQVAESPESSGWMIAAGAFWAARANLQARRPQDVDHWMEISATYPRTFYGLLARRVLGYDTLSSGDDIPLTDADAKALTRTPGGRRALALMQVGDKDAAEEELRKAYPQAGKTLRQAILAMAQASDMDGLVVRLGGMAPTQTDDASAFPVPSWNPRGGWRVERALVYAFVRQESAFDPQARSASGARGLMQIMPETAVEVGGIRSREQISNPEINLAIGQRYLSALLSQDPINGNLLYLAAAYNAGPGKLGQWLDNNKTVNDPLLFIETLPSRQTRGFVERVLTNYWVYQVRLSQSSPSLDQIASGQWPIYEAQAALGAREGKVSSR
jgi:soluble lytic murein transglycosylase